MKIIDWFIARLKEPSSLRVVTVVAGVIGYNIAPEFLDQITAVVLGVIGVIEFCKKERPVTKIVKTLQLLALCLLLPACTTTYSVDAKGNPVKTVVPDKEFVNSASKLAADAAKQAMDKYFETHRPASAVTLPPIILPSK